MERVTTEQDRPSEEGMSSKCKVQRESLAEQTVRSCPLRGSSSSNVTQTVNSDPTVGHSNPQADQQDSKSLEPERLSDEDKVSGSPSETSDKPRAIISVGGDKSLRPPAPPPPLRLRRLPASFWQEPNVPKGDPSGKLMATDGCFGSCSCQLHRPSFQNDAPFGYADYGFRSKYLDPVNPPVFHRPGHSFASISKFSGDPLELAYLDAIAAPWRQGPVSFPTAPAIARGAMRPVFADGTGGSSANTAFSATAALYSHMMRRSLHGNYHHSNDVLTDHLVSPIVGDDLWRLLPNRPLLNDFSKRFHPYL